ncbi:MAG TPA: SWIM zinc finger domain-containing protein [Gemmatales bacterium]|nr:SWIM zinc finger domain-containing protein [Gemmatales bacterium]
MIRRPKDFQSIGDVAFNPENKGETSSRKKPSPVASPPLAFQELIAAARRLTIKQRSELLALAQNPRQWAGMVIAATKSITEGPRGWLVASQTGDSVYTVRLDLMPAKCSCADSMARKLKCKHIWAAEMVKGRGCP